MGDNANEKFAAKLDATTQVLAKETARIERNQSLRHSARRERREQREAALAEIAREQEEASAKRRAARERERQEREMRDDVERAGAATEAKIEAEEKARQAELLEEKKRLEEAAAALAVEEARIERKHALSQSQRRSRRQVRGAVGNASLATTFPAAADVAVGDATTKHRYGTAGFRAEASTLTTLMPRVGMIAVLRARAMGGKRVVGVMVTASHNAAGDNGVKIIDVDGGMISEKQWEDYCTTVANASSSSSSGGGGGSGGGGVMDELDRIRKVHMNDDDAGVALQTHAAVVVVVGRDTRPHSKGLVEKLKAGIEAVGGVVVDYGIVTTPQLHWLVRVANATVNGVALAGGDSAVVAAAVGTTTTAAERAAAIDADVYTAAVAAAFVAAQPNATTTSSIESVVIDAAHGVGSIHAAALRKQLHKMATANSTTAAIAITIINDTVHEEGAALDAVPLNDRCGADYVQKTRLPPRGSGGGGSGGGNGDGSELFASFDGDADRVVFYYNSGGSGSDVVLLDGDRITALLTAFCQQQLSVADLSDSLSVGVVQTAYANGASTSFLADRLKVPVACVKTGVKHLHSRAHDFDIGVYFEANGHGTVLFSDKAIITLREKASNGDADVAAACGRLLAFASLSNHAIGDAIADLLLVVTVLRYRQWTAKEWRSMYDDLPSIQSKVAASRAALDLIVVSDDERRVVKPAALQEAIDAAVAASGDKCARAFVRPSGTEDVVRLYVEAGTADGAAALQTAVTAAVGDALK